MKRTLGVKLLAVERHIGINVMVHLDKTSEAKNMLDQFLPGLVGVHTVQVATKPHFGPSWFINMYTFSTIQLANVHMISMIAVIL